MELPGLIAKGEAVRSGKKRIPVPTWQEIQISVLIALLVLWHWCPSYKIWMKVEAEGGKVGKADEKKPKKQGCRSGLAPETPTGFEASHFTLLGLRLLI